MDIGFALNWANLYLVDTTPDAEQPTWARIGQGISSVETDDSDETSEDYYYDGEGSPETDVTGVSFAYTFEGHRYHGNAAQDYIVGLRFSKGSSRRTHFRHIAPDGSMVEGDCTVTDIEPTGGDANEKQTFGCKIALNGTPTYTQGKGTDAPESVTIADVTVKVGKVVTAAAKVVPTTANDACAWASSDPAVATVDDAGNVTGIKAGSCEISAKSMVKPTVSAVGKVTVSA